MTPRFTYFLHPHESSRLLTYILTCGAQGVVGSLSALLLWVYVFVMTVVMVNLLIAQVE